MLERLVGTGALLAVFAAVAGGASASSSALPRATTDRPDDVLGPQVHFVYAVPADGGDRHLDDSGTIEGSVELFQRWLRGETGAASASTGTRAHSTSASRDFARPTRSLQPAPAASSEPP